MAHFAELDNNNIVKKVIVIHNNELMENGIENETKGIYFLTNLFGHNRWKQTSYSGSFRKNYAGIGYYYDSTKDAFISPKPFASWILDDNCRWNAPQPYPSDNKVYNWDEENLVWREVI